jgi:hypothetical protein
MTCASCGSGVQEAQGRRAAGREITAPPWADYRGDEHRVGNHRDTDGKKAICHDALLLRLCAMAYSGYWVEVGRPEDRGQSRYEPVRIVP